MEAFRNAVFIMFRRPFIILFLSLITLVFCTIDYINPVFNILLNLSGAMRGNFFDGFVSSLQIIFNKSFITTGLFIILGVFTFISILTALIFSGYFNVINNALDGKPKFSGEFLFGFKKYFFKVMMITLKVFILSFILILFLSVASVPAIVVTRSLAAGKSGYLFLTILIDIITIAVLFFGFMYFRIYVTFWIPAAINHEKRAFAIGKQTADSNFWGLVGAFVLFDLAFIFMQLIMLYGGKMIPSIPLFAANWVFKTFFFAAFITFIFSSFKILRENVQ